MQRPGTAPPFRKKNLLAFSSFPCVMLFLVSNNITCVSFAREIALSIELDITKFFIPVDLACGSSNEEKAVLHVRRQMIRREKKMCT